MPDYNDLITTYTTTATLGNETITAPRNINDYLYIDNNYTWHPTFDTTCIDIKTDYIRRDELNWKMDELARKIYKVIKESAHLDIDEDDFIRMLQDAN